MNKPTCAWILIAFLAAACLCASAGVLLLIGSPLLSLLQTAAPLAEGSPAPDFDLPGLAGGQVKISAYRGQPVLVSLGATW